ncbi:PilZ domain-containing protein [Haliangium sp.]|uniref:PilZ domain-containing protein n=1 Tax=Haliangium sp. TaxID=2663208 RepID=UPI003D14BF8C
MLQANALVNRRSSHRYTVTLAAEIVVYDGNDDSPCDATLRDLSLGGASVDFSERLRLGQRVRVSFQLPGHDVRVEADAVVRWASAGQVGLQFASMSPRYTWSLNRYFAALDEQPVAAMGG